MSDGTRVTSAGYADDTAILAASQDHALIMHTFVREFFGGARVQNKCQEDGFYVRITQGVLACVRSVPLAGQWHYRRTHCTPSRELCFSVLRRPWMLDWTEEVERLDRLVAFVVRRIRALAIPCAPAADAVRAMLVPRMEAGLGLIPLTTKNKTIIKKWNRLLRLAVLSNEEVVSAHSLSANGFYCVTDIPGIGEARHGTAPRAGDAAYVHAGPVPYPHYGL